MEQHKLKPFSQINPSPYLDKLPITLQELIKEQGFDIYYIPVPVVMFIRYLEEVLKANLSNTSIDYKIRKKLLDGTIYSIVKCGPDDPSKTYYKVLIETTSEKIILLFFNATSEQNEDATSIILTSDKDIIEWCVFLEQLYYSLMKRVAESIEV